MARMNGHMSRFPWSDAWVVPFRMRKQKRHRHVFIESIYWFEAIPNLKRGKYNSRPNL